MKKQLFLLSVSALLSLTGCGVNQQPQELSQIRTIYNLYVENGGDLSYDEWLQTIKGEDGKDGKDGASVLTGNGEPYNSKGKDGDSYIDLDTCNFYVKSNGKWVLSGNLCGREVYKESYKNILNSRNYTIEYSLGGDDTVYKAMYADEGFMALNGNYFWFFGEHYYLVQTDENNEPFINLNFANLAEEICYKEILLGTETFGEYVKYTTFLELNGYSDKLVATRPYTNGQDVIFQKIINTLYNDESIKQLSAMPYASVVFNYTKADELTFYLVNDYRDLTNVLIYLQGKIYNVNKTTLGFTPKIVYRNPSEGQE